MGWDDDYESGFFKRMIMLIVRTIKALEGKMSFKRIVQVGVVVIIGIFGLMISLGSFFLVKEGERGILTRNGRFVAVVNPGLSFKLPILDTVVPMEIRNMSIESDMRIYSSDTQQYAAKVVVNYELDPASVETIFKREGMNYADRRLRPLVDTQLKEVAGKYSAQRTIQERDIYGGDVKMSIKDAAKEYNIIVTEVQVKNIDFTDQFEKAIENAMLAKAKVEEEKNILEQKRIQAETKVVEATAEANALRERAKGEADAKTTQAAAEAGRITMTGEAEATAINKKAEAIAKNPALTAYTYALAAQNWDGKLPEQFVPGSTLPIVNLTPGTEVK